MLRVVITLITLGLIPEARATPLLSPEEKSQLEELTSSTELQANINKMMNDLRKHQLSRTEEDQLHEDINVVLQEAQKHRAESCGQESITEFSNTIHNPFYVCVSFSMPLHVIRALGKDLEKVGGTLVFRGLKENSFKKTIAALMPIMKEGTLPIVLDPNVFRDHHVTRVPTFIFVDHHGNATQLSGNVNVAYALEKISHNLGINSEAQTLLAGLKERK